MGKFIFWAWYLILDHWAENDWSTEDRGAWLALLLFEFVLLALLFRKLVLREDARTAKDRVE